MWSFFYGWRRKAGGVTLVMACVFAAAWVGSLTEMQALFRLNENDTHLVASVDGNISWERIWPIPTPRRSRWVHKRNRIVGPNDPDSDCDVHWNITGFGFDFRAFSKLETGAGVPPYTQEFALWQIPYWSITIPLTLLSAYLILWKPLGRESSAPPANLNLNSN
ncbi:MAG: hypothetical protein JWP89_5118 [Schlesneria sp.]|nr:hypothetical protein [Schlesneria sp.]